LLAGTWGARPDRDGNDGLCNPANIASNIPIELAECEYPVRIERYGLVQDSGGAGQYRGGLAIERSWRLLGSEANLTIRSDRRAYPPYGLAGGEVGAPSSNLLQRSDARVSLPTMVATGMMHGELIHHQMPGGGGWGDPLDRDPAAVARDVRDDKVSLAAARVRYGVALDPTDLTVDRAATTALRVALRAERP
jgi:N-methylhydantoinase B